MSRTCSSLFLSIFVLLNAPATADDFIAGYHLEGKYLLLGRAMAGADGGMKPFAEMTPPQIATIYHELWHAYFLECEAKNGGELALTFRRKADRLYDTSPADKRVEIYEEAVADFIDAVISTHVQVKRFLAEKSPARRREIRETTRFLNVYGRLFEEEYTGYYTRSVRPQGKQEGGGAGPPRPTTATLALKGGSSDPEAEGYEVLKGEETLGGFIADAKRFGLPIDYVKSAAAALEGVIFIDTARGQLQADVVMSWVPLDGEDMNLVVKTLFEGILTRDPQVVFAEERF